ncbi:hypothetical protein SLE2022_083440 [Rubroshorea leprosula]
MTEPVKEAPIQSRTPELRKDPVTNRWVVFSPARAKRPTDFKSKASGSHNIIECAFCIGHESECAPEIFRIPPKHPNWKLRVIENLYPAVSRSPECQFGQNSFVKHETGDWGLAIPGFGFHDVVIEAPLHSVRLSDLDPKAMGDVILAYKTRIEQIARHDSVKYVQVFKNHGASAGASMTHSHSQMLSLPIVPPSVSVRLDSMKEYFNRTGKCCLCEVQLKDLLINETSNFISIVPFAASFPFEIWIIPRYHASHLHEIDADKAVEFGGLLKLMLRKIALQLNDPPFNFMFHTSPLRATDSELPYMHWYLQIVPQLTGVGGFELGTGCYINPVFPEDAAQVLRDVSNQVAD